MEYHGSRLRAMGLCKECSDSVSRELGGAGFDRLRVEDQVEGVDVNRVHQGLTDRCQMVAHAVTEQGPIYETRSHASRARVAKTCENARRETQLEEAIRADGKSPQVERQRQREVLVCELADGYRACDLLVHHARRPDHPQMQKVLRLAEPMECHVESMQLDDTATLNGKTAGKVGLCGDQCRLESLRQFFWIVTGPSISMGLSGKSVESNNVFSMGGDGVTRTT